ncbi:MAG: hypothetical protein SFW62_05540 [Alphaproteobacteria bacterium]|nr:hypothetical protein [Alphaproteobacteria bacterium]
MELQYKVSVKNGAGWRAFPDVQLLISVGQPYHEGPKFAAVVAWLRQQQRKTVHVAVNDTLQRWNSVAEGVDEKRAFADAELAGQKWIGSHADILASFQTVSASLTTPSVSVTRWREWLEHPGYAAAKACVDEIVSDTRNGLSDILKRDSANILKRREKTVSNREKFLVCSGEYIREEIAVLALQHADKPRADIYPGTMLKSIEWFRTAPQTLPPELEPLRHRYSCRIDFKRIEPKPA